MTQTILAPVMALVLWSLVMWAWLYVTRIPAMRKARIRLDPDVPTGTLTQALPPRVRWKADNYNHLMEQPTIFYATALALAVAGSGGGLNLWLAWAYVGLRIAHSLVQALVNLIVLRWALFMAATLVLVALALRAALRVF
ncbi:MAG: MAPEG family protein [Alphaproteobacteria bacterium]|nr:MAPEG family protein [Alphaproteobacteria bacterium]MBU1525665.1 MAPEG family protein [Alphaproteobacteria bacterium]MBU2351954.1 MAPEG family protein [Alphaproteobacteria bacterium]MBU2383731.1 MAPEG family protein [Alphaproteobacteria bacterium]